MPAGGFVRIADDSGVPVPTRVTAYAEGVLSGWILPDLLTQGGLRRAEMCFEAERLAAIRGVTFFEVWGRWRIRAEESNTRPQYGAPHYRVLVASTGRRAWFVPRTGPVDSVGGWLLPSVEVLNRILATRGRGGGNLELERRAVIDVLVEGAASSFGSVVSCDGESSWFVVPSEPTTMPLAIRFDHDIEVLHVGTVSRVQARCAGR